MKFNSVFFFCVLLCLILGSLSCSESKNAQLDRKVLDSGVQAAERIVKRKCSEQNLSETACAELMEVNVGAMREGMKEQIRRFDENCKNSTSFEEQCLEQKQEAFQKILNSDARVK
jgi:hypothetical protein